MKKLILISALLLFSFDLKAEYYNKNMVEMCRAIAEGKQNENTPRSISERSAFCQGFFTFALDLNQTWHTPQFQNQEKQKLSQPFQFENVFMRVWFPCRFNGTVAQYIAVYVQFIDRNPAYLEDSVMQVIGLATEPYCPR
jgi:hypothetical protein